MKIRVSWIHCILSAELLAQSVSGCSKDDNKTAQDAGTIASDTAKPSNGMDSGDSTFNPNLILGGGCLRLSSEATLISEEPQGSTTRVDAVSVHTDETLHLMYNTAQSGASNVKTRRVEANGQLNPSETSLTESGSASELATLVKSGERLLLAEASNTTLGGYVSLTVLTEDSEGKISPSLPVTISGTDRVILDLHSTKIGDAGFAVAWTSALPVAGTPPTLGPAELYYAFVTLNAEGKPEATPAKVNHPQTLGSITLARGFASGSSLIFATFPNGSLESTLWTQNISTDGKLADKATEVAKAELVGPIAAARVWNTATLIGWGMRVASTRKEVHLKRIDDDGSSTSEVAVTLGVEQGTHPAFAVSDFYIMLAYIGGTTNDSGVRVLPVSPFGEGLTLPDTLTKTNITQPGRLSIASARRGSTLSAIWTDVLPEKTRILAAIAECTE